VVICLERGADLHMFQLMPLPLTVSCFSKIQIGFTFLVPAHPGSPGQRGIKRVCVCVCVRACVWPFIIIMTHVRLWRIDRMIMINITWLHFDQSAKQLIVGHTTNFLNIVHECSQDVYYYCASPCNSTKFACGKLTNLGLLYTIDLFELNVI